MVTDLLALAIAAFAVDGIVWGVAGFFVFRLLGGRKRWWIGILGTSIALVAYQAFLLLRLINVLDLTIGDEQIAYLLGADRLAHLITFDPLSDLLVSVVAIAIGFLLAGFLDELARRRRGVAPASDAR